MRALGPLRSSWLLFATALALGGCSRTAVFDVEPGLGPTAPGADGGLPGDDAGRDAGADAGAGDLGPGQPDGASDAGPDGGLPRQLVQIAVDPALTTLPLMGQQRYTAIALYGDGTREDVSLGATWRATPPLVGFAGSIATALSPGETTITATYGGLEGTARLAITERRVVRIEVLPASARAPAGVELAFTAEGVLEDGSRLDLTESAEWRSSNPGVVAVELGGRARTLATGRARVVAAFSGLEGAAAVEVTAATRVSLSVEPVEATLLIGAALPLRATALYSDGTSGDVSGLVAWSASDPSVLTVDATGLATAVVAGTAIVTAALDGLAAVATITVTEARVVSLVVTPVSVTLAVGGTAQLVATATLEDGRTLDVSANAAWLSSDLAVVAVDAAGPSSGLVTALAPGRAAVTALFGGLSASAELVVSPAALVGLTVTPPRATTGFGGSVGFTAAASYDDGSTRDVTTSVAWASSDPAVALVSAAGTASAVGEGTARITATLDGQTAVAVLVVGPAPLVSIALSPANATMTLGQTTSYLATGTYADGRTADLTGQATWTTRDAAVATVSNVSGTRGQVFARGVGSTAVAATFGGVTGSTTVTVVGPALTQVVVTPANRSVPTRTLIQYTATASYADGSTRNVTALAGWSSSDPRVASITAVGTLTAQAPGSVTVTASYAGASGSTALTVEEALPVQLQVSPVSPTLVVGTAQVFQAVVIYSDGTSRTVTNAATWTSSDPGVVALGGGGGPGGGGRSLARAVAPGVATLSAAAMGLTGTTQVTVSDGALVSLSISPVAATLVVGAQRQLQATAIYSDGSSRTVTPQATWTSSDPMVAQVSAGRGRGVVTALAPGMATITAAYQGLRATATVLVSSASLVSVQVSPFAPTVAVGTPIQFQAVAVYSDGSSTNVTNQATWTSSDPSVAAPSNAGGGPGGGMRGLTTTLAPGTAVITASYQGIDGVATLTVTGATIVQIQVTPFAPIIPVGYPLAMRATAIYSDQTFRDITNLATWISSAPTVAGVSGAGMTRGLVTPVAPGVTHVEVRYQGATGNTPVTVTSETLQSLRIAPSPAMLGPGQALQLTATGSFSGGTSLDLTDLVTWQSSTPTIADVSNAVGSHGLASGFASGSVTVTATRGAVSAQTTLVVR